MGEDIREGRRDKADTLNNEKTGNQGVMRTKQAQWIMRGIFIIGQRENPERNILIRETMIFSFMQNFLFAVHNFLVE